VRKFLDVIKEPIAKTEATRVTCGTCPVSMACMIGQGGNGWKFDCCGATGFVLEGVGTLAIDCSRNEFEQNKDAKKYRQCPLCSGGIMEVVERSSLDGGNDANRYLLTAHAKVPLEDRVKLWKDTHAAALTRIRDERDRIRN
jgi:hypothetical protein